MSSLRWPNSKILTWNTPGALLAQWGSGDSMGGRKKNKLSYLGGVLWLVWERGDVEVFDNWAAGWIGWSGRNSKFDCRLLFIWSISCQSTTPLPSSSWVGVSFGHDLSATGHKDWSAQTNLFQGYRQPQREKMPDEAQETFLYWMLYFSILIRMKLTSQVKIDLSRALEFKCVP